MSFEQIRRDSERKLVRIVRGDAPKKVLEPKKYAVLKVLGKKQKVVAVNMTIDEAAVFARTARVQLRKIRGPLAQNEPYFEATQFRIVEQSDGRDE